MTVVRRSIRVLLALMFVALGVVSLLLIADPLFMAIAGVMVIAGLGAAVWALMGPLPDLDSSIVEPLAFELFVELAGFAVICALIAGVVLLAS